MKGRVGGGGVVVALGVFLAGAAHAQEIGVPEPPPRAAQEGRVVGYTLDLASSSKNLSLGVKFRYQQYLETSLATDAILSSLLSGFALDDIDGLRVTASQTVGAKITWNGLEPRHGGRPRTGSHPDFVAGVGIWGVGEMDSLAQGARLGDNGVYSGVSVGAFGSFVFSDVTVTLAYRPISQTRYYLAGRWDSTELNVGNPVLDIDLSYTFR